MVKKKGQADTEAKRDKRAQKRNKFLENCREAGLVFEHQNCNVSLNSSNENVPLK